MSFTKEEYNALKKALANGVHSVTYSDKTVTYRSLSDMRKLLRQMEAELFPQSVPRRRRLAEFDCGFHTEGQ